MKKVLALLMAMTLVLTTLTACGGSSNSASEPAKEESSEEVKEEAPAAEKTSEESSEEVKEEASEESKTAGMDPKDLKIALILSGAITDGSWNANGYNALKKNCDELGITFQYIENVQQADMESAMRDFCEQGCNLIIGHGSQFDDAMKAVAANYPNIYFFEYNGEIQADNIFTLRNSSDENAFITGALAATATKTGTIGWIGAVEVPTTSDVFDGYAAGAKYVNPDVKVLSAYVGSYDDTAKAKELCNTMIEQGADVIQSNANQGTAGIIEAAYEYGTDKGLMLIGNTRDQYEDAPEFMLSSCVIDFPTAYRIPIDMLLNGTWHGGIEMCTVGNGVMGIAPYHDFEDKLTDEQKAVVEQVTADLSAGKLNALLPCDYSAFGRPNE